MPECRRLSVCPPVRPSVCLSDCLPVCLSVHLSVCPSVHPSVRPFVSLSILPSVRLSVRLSFLLNKLAQLKQAFYLRPPFTRVKVFMTLAIALATQTRKNMYLR
jgi:hypothetical protein